MYEYPRRISVLFEDHPYAEEHLQSRYGEKAYGAWLKSRRWAQESVRAGILGEQTPEKTHQYPIFESFRKDAAELVFATKGSAYFERKFAVTPYRLQLS